MTTAPDQEVPTSLAQQYRLEHDRAHSAHPRQQPIVMAWRVEGTLDFDRLQAALDHLLELHVALRSTFPHADAVQRAVVVPGPMRWPIVRLPSGAGLEAVAVAIWDSPWDFAAAPLVGAFVGADLLVLVVEHLLFDAVSIELLVRSLSVAYEAARSHSRESLPARQDTSYYALAAAERASTGSERVETVTGFWDAHWGASPAYPATGLSADGAHPERYQAPGVWHEHPLPGDGERIRRTAAEAAATPFAVGLTAVALAERSLRGDGRAGAMFPTANRTGRAAGSVVGFFANPVCCYLDLADGLDPRRAVRSVQGAVLDAVEHQDVITQSIIARARPDEDHLGLETPHVFFDVREPTALPTPVLAGVELRAIDSQPYHAWRLYPGVNLSLVLIGEDAALRVHFTPEAYRPTSIATYTARVADCLAEVLDASAR